MAGTALTLAEEMDASESTWQLTEISNDSGPMLIRKLLDAFPGEHQPADHVVYLTFGCNSPPSGQSFYTEVDSATFADLDETDIPALEKATGALLVGVVSAPRLRDFIFYTADPHRFLDTASPLRARFPQFQIGCECSPDPTWSQYCDLPPSETSNG